MGEATTDPNQAEGPAPGEAIFVNRNLRMDCIEAVGFDMDYTLARYARVHLEELAHRLTLDKLVARGYPEAIRGLPYEAAFVIRGLVVDKLLGNVLKLDRHNHPGRVYHGTRPLERAHKRATYRRERIAFVPPRFIAVDTLFSLPEVSLYAHLVDFFDARRATEADAGPNYAQLFDDVRACIDEAHRDGTLKSEVSAALGRYIERDVHLVPMLQALRAAGKKVFLATNSQWAYTDAVMDWLVFGEQAAGGERSAQAGQGRHGWCALFDLVVVGAQKPDFFARPDPFVPLGLAGVPDHVVARGSLTAAERHLGASGEAVLYVGDHIFGDILRSKKTSLWRTALVVEELEDEIVRTRQLTADRRALLALDERRLALEAALRLHKDAVSPEGHQLLPSLHQAHAFAKANLQAVLQQIRTVQHTLADAFNPYWGMVFKEGHENSRFGEQVVGYACVYMARATNLIHYPLDAYFRSPRDYMPHEPRDAAVVATAADSSARAP